MEAYNKVHYSGIPSVVTGKLGLLVTGGVHHKTVGVCSLSVEDCDVYDFRDTWRLTFKPQLYYLTKASLPYPVCRTVFCACQWQKVLNADWLLLVRHVTNQIMWTLSTFTCTV